MLHPRSLADVTQNLLRPDTRQLPAPPYAPLHGQPTVRAMFAVSSMAQHMTDEGWQLAQSLAYTGYRLVGHGCPDCSVTNVRTYCDTYSPQTIVLQDKREWDLAPRDFRDHQARFDDVQWLRDQTGIFKLTVLKDSHQRPHYHRQSAEEIGAHGWIIYYHPKIVAHLAPYIREEHCIRTFHSLNPDHVPAYNSAPRKAALLSGAVSGAYPLRQRLTRHASALHGCDVLPHPGYHRNGCATPAYLKKLSEYKVAICTSSIYGYALRKLIEATAVGCAVITDLPYDDVLPGIDDNLARIHPEESIANINKLIDKLVGMYDPRVQYDRAMSALAYYNYTQTGIRLARAIENLRQKYALPSSV